MIEQEVKSWQCWYKSSNAVKSLKISETKLVGSNEFRCKMPECIWDIWTGRVRQKCSVKIPSSKCIRGTSHYTPPISNRVQSLLASAIASSCELQLNHERARSVCVCQITSHLVLEIKSDDDGTGTKTSDSHDTRLLICCCAPAADSARKQMIEDHLRGQPPLKLESRSRKERSHLKFQQRH